MNTTTLNPSQSMAQISIKRIYKHPIAKVWSAISEAEALSTWLMPVSNLRLEKGNRFQFKTEPRGNFDGIVNCSVVDYEEPHYLQLSWQATGMAQPTIVIYRLSDLGDGRTLLHLTHDGFRGFSGQVTRMILSFGWKSLLKKKLSKYLIT